MDHNPWDDLEETAARAESRARRDQAGAESEAEQARLAARTMIEVVWEYMQAGHVVRAVWQGGSVTGQIVAAVNDLIAIRSDDETTAIYLDALVAIEVVERRAKPGASGDRTVESFVAYLRMVERRQATIWLIGGERIVGSIEAVGQDQVTLKRGTDRDVAVARQALAAVSLVGDGFLVTYPDSEGR